RTPTHVAAAVDPAAVTNGTGPMAVAASVVVATWVTAMVNVPGVEESISNVHWPPLEPPVRQLDPSGSSVPVDPPVVTSSVVPSGAGVKLTPSLVWSTAAVIVRWSPASSTAVDGVSVARKPTHVLDAWTGTTWPAA